MEIATLNEPVPDFTASATGSRRIYLSAFRGKNLVLYFYPKDHTPGCTREGQNFRDFYRHFQDLNAEILGVSRDSLKMHESFKAKQELPFDLISDPEETLCNLFGVIKMKNMYGKQVRGIERSTFLIDGNGVLIREWRNVKVKDHVEKVLNALTELSHH